MTELLAGLVPGLPDDLRDRILDRAEGVPLYAVETVRMLLDRGLLVQEGNVYRPTGSVATLDVPETLHALIAARLDSLTQEERRLVQNGAVLGKTFTRNGLEVLTGLSAAELEPLLTSLLRKEVLSIQADTRSPERGQYAFLQDIVKHVAYETISKKERKAKHLAAAEFLSSLPGAEEDEIVDVIATHYLDAYAAAREDPDAEEIRSTARELLVRAGERAASLAANQEAQRAFERALELTAEPLVQAELQERAGTMARIGGRADEAAAHYERAIELFEAAGATHPAARLSAAAGRDHVGPGTPRTRVGEHERVVRGALAGGARRGSRSARRPARPLPLLRRRTGSRVRAHRGCARPGRSSLAPGDPLPGTEHEGDDSRRA